MKSSITFGYNYIISDIRRKKIGGEGKNIRNYLLNNRLVNSNVSKDAITINEYIKEQILAGHPFFVGRFGGTELFCLRTFDFEIKSRYGKALHQMKINAGFFSNTIDQGIKYKDLMLLSIPEVDVMGIWLQPFEDYYLNRFGNGHVVTTFIHDLEPWTNPKNPWSSALEGKRVLVIHPFAETIEKQYLKRKDIFPETNILPEFQLKTLKAVQTIAGEKDDRFLTWFDALEWMYKEAMKIDFDIAIIGCGAYGFPLAAKLKSAGKQAIHLGGPTQLLFGIKGKRWEENQYFSYVNRFFNDAWVYPSEKDRPRNADNVENGCYW